LAESAIHHWLVLLASVFSLGVAVIAAWYILSRRGVARAVASGVAALALLVFVVVVVASESLIVLAVGLGLAALSIGAANYALSPAAVASALERAPGPHHPVLLMNPRSGGGKAERFRLADLCRQRNIEPIVVRPGDDLRQLAEDAVARGADVLGMAGGDGSGRVFVNNASMGVYAKIVQSADYRDAKVLTAAAMLPDLLGPAATPLDLRFTLPSGQEATAAQLLLVSNNPYQVAQLRGGGTRERLDGGVLGVVSVRVDTAADAERLAALELAGNVRRFASWNDWAPSEFEVRSAGPVEVGIDGEALTLQPPLRFVIRPGALTVRLPRIAVRRSPAARAVRVIAKPTLAALWQTVLGRPTRIR
jgi:diacylglycerol kinase family enzyme